MRMGQARKLYQRCLREDSFQAGCLWDTRNLDQENLQGSESVMLQSVHRLRYTNRSIEGKSQGERLPRRLRSTPPKRRHFYELQQQDTIGSDEPEGISMALFEVFALNFFEVEHAGERTQSVNACRVHFLCNCP